MFWEENEFQSVDLEWKDLQSYTNLEHTLQDISPPAPFVRDIDVSNRAAIDHGQQGHFKLNSRSIEEDLLSFQDTDARGAQLDPPNFPDSESSHT